MRHLVFCCALIAVVASASLGAVTPVPIEGTILVSANAAGIGLSVYYIEGSSDHVTMAPSLFLSGEISPYMDRVVYSIKDAWPATVSDVWTARIDGSEAVNLTSLAGLGGVSCSPAWSPDARKIVFQHADATASIKPCDAGWSVWVMDADGTDAHRVTSVSLGPSWSPTWSPNGYRLTCYTGMGAFSVDSDGTDLAALPNVADSADWSPDGSKIVSVLMREDTDQGSTGIWREIILTNADGSDPQVLFRRFVTDSDVMAHLAIYGPEMPANINRFDAVREAIGPSRPRWSPMGDRILFRAAIPFDPQGLFCHWQIDLWLYDLKTGDLTNITQNVVCEYCHSWDGPNTSPEDPEVSVDNVTVTFSNVTAAGVTTIVRDDDPPDVPTGFRFDYEFYELNTTAQVTGPATICMSYAHPDIPEGAAEDQLAILHYDEALQVWEDITTSHDPVGNVVCGQTDTLSPVAFYGVRETRFQDVPAWGYGALGLDPQWAYYQIMACAKAGVVQGSGGYYFPNDAVTRDQLAVYIARAMNGGDPTGPATVAFTDITNPWANVYIAYCVEHGVVQGFDATHYGPTLVVDRGSMAVFVARSQGWVVIGEDMTKEAPVFEDVPLGHWAGKAIKACVDHGVVHGYDPTHYLPEGIVTRDQMAVFVQKAFQLPM